MKRLVFCTAAMGIAWLAGGVIGSGSTDSNSPPGQPPLIAPEHGAAAVSLSPVLDVAVSDPDGESFAVVFENSPGRPRAERATSRPGTLPFLSPLDE